MRPLRWRHLSRRCLSTLSSARCFPKTRIIDNEAGRRDLQHLVVAEFRRGLGVAGVVEVAVSLVEAFKPQLGKSQISRGSRYLNAGPQIEATDRQEVRCRRETEVEVDKAGHLCLLLAVEHPIDVAKPVDLIVECVAA